MLRVLMLLAALGLPMATLRAQAPEAEPAAAAEPEAAELTEEELDDLVAPVALYPDALLAQVFVAATYPLDVVKAARWTGNNETLSGEDRTAAAEAEGWDPSLAVLAAGFPDVIERMADEIDWTENLGNALLADPEPVLDAVQRQRARAAAVGNLENNAAQTVTVEGDTISIAPAEPEVVYVPAYNPQTVYTQPATAAPVVVTDPNDEGYSSGDLIATGVIAFGAGMLINELFDDDDDWNGYWGGPPPVNWGGGSFYPRPGFNVGGDVNIDIDRGNLDIDRDGAWRPAPERRDRAREQIASRDQTRPRDRTRPDATPRDRDRAALQDSLKARSGEGPKLQRPDGAGRPQARPATRESAFDGRRDGLTGAGKARDRGAASAGGGARPKIGGDGGNRPKLGGGGGRDLKAARPARDGGARPQRASAPKAGALQRGGGGGNHAAAAKARGARSAGGGGGKLRR